MDGPIGDKNKYSESQNYAIRQAHLRTNIFKDRPGILWINCKLETILKFKARLWWQGAPFTRVQEKMCKIQSAGNGAHNVSAKPHFGFKNGCCLNSIYCILETCKI